MATDKTVTLNNGQKVAIPSDIAGTSAETQYVARLNSRNTTPVQQTAVNAQQNLTQPQQQAARDTAMGTALQKSTTMNNYTFQDTPNAQAQLKINQQYNLPELKGLTGTAVNADKTPVTKPRDFSAEIAMAKKMGIDFATMTPAMEKELFLATYGTQDLKDMRLDKYTSEGNLGSALKSPNAPQGQGSQGRLPNPAAYQGLLDDLTATLGADGAQKLLSMDPETLKSLGIDPSVVQGLLKETQSMASAPVTSKSQANSQLGVLQAALQKVSGVGSVGDSVTSALPGMAGLPTTGSLGFAGLSTSLAMHQDEMKANFQQYNQVLSQAGGVYANALDAYSQAQSQYTKRLDMVQKAADTMKQYQNTMNQMVAQNKLDEEKQAQLTILQAEYKNKNWTPFTVTNTDGTKQTVMYDSFTGEIRQMTDAQGNITAGDGYSGDYSPAAAAPQGYSYIGSDLVKDDYYNNLFGAGTYGGQCGTWASTVSTASKVGNSWAEKKTKIQASGDTIINGEYIPKAGDKLLIPLAVKSGKGTGHVAVVTSYDAQTGDIQVVESNKGLNGIIHKGKYNINDLVSKYGADNVGVAKGELKSKYAQGVTKAEQGYESSTVGKVIDKNQVLNELVNMGYNIAGQQSQLQIPENVKYQAPTTGAAGTSGFNFKNTVNIKNGEGANDIGEIAKGIIDGTQPPDFKGLYSKSAGVRAELARQGYDVKGATMDWTALQAYTKTMNSSRVLQLRSSAQTAMDSLDLVTNYSNQLQNLVPRDKYPVLNKAAVIAAKQGVFGQGAQNAATILDQQISDISSELASVYKGGGQATDDALKLGATQLSSDWDKALLDAAIVNVKKNLNIRLNSYKALGPETYTAPSATANDSLSLDSATTNKDSLGIL